MASQIVNEGSSALLRFQLLDQDDDPTANGDVSAMTVTLSNKADATVINSRTAQDIFGANGGAVGGDLTITAATQANPVVITTSADHALKDGDYIQIDSVAGMTELNERRFRVTRVNDTQLELRNENGKLHTAYSSAGTIKTGLITLQLAAADNPIVGSITAGDTETHEATFTITYGASLIHTHMEEIKVRSLTKIT